MEKVACATCQRARTTLRCGLCDAPACKTCAHLLDEDAFSFLPAVPDHLTKGIYCHDCFQARIAGEQESYERTMAAARAIDIYLKDQGKETRLIRRVSPPVTVKGCSDRDELILRLAFLAAKDGFTTLVDVDVVGEKVRLGTYQKVVYRGSAVPAHARADQIPRDKSLRHNPN